MKVSSPIRALRLAIPLVLSAMFTPSCEDNPATAITIAISSEASVPKEIDAISLEIRRGTRVVFSRSYVVDPVTGQAKIPGSLTLKLHEDEEPGETIRVQLRAEQKSEQVVLRSAATTFVKEKNKLLRLILRYSCLDFPRACDAGQTCLGGRCADEFIDPLKLPDAPAEEQVFPTISQGGCFDGSDEKCAAERVPVADLAAFTSAGCAFDAATAPGYKAGNLNVFAFWASQSDQVHPLVVDQDAQEGWSYLPPSTSIFQLAPGLCDQVKSGQITKVAFNFTCPTKTLSLPVCLPEANTTPGAFDKSACHTCAYTPPQCKELFDKAAAEAASQPLFEAAFACPYDGSYTTQDECEGVRGCFLGALTPILTCLSPDCETKYPAAKAWEACVANLDNPADRCGECAAEKLDTCKQP